MSKPQKHDRGGGDRRHAHDELIPVMRLFLDIGSPRGRHHAHWVCKFGVQENRRRKTSTSVSIVPPISMYKDYQRTVKLLLARLDEAMYIFHEIGFSIHVFGISHQPMKRHRDEVLTMHSAHHDEPLRPEPSIPSKERQERRP